jgi:serine/threonine protein kinase
MLLGEEFILDKHYKLERLLGSGAYGVVCEVIDQRTDIKYAIKKCKNVFVSIQLQLPTMSLMLISLFVFLE